MEAKEIRNLGEKELDEALEEAREELFTLRFQKATSGLANSNRFREVKRHIARLLTVRRERELWSEFEAKAAPGAAKRA